MKQVFALILLCATTALSITEEVLSKPQNWNNWIPSLVKTGSEGSEVANTEAACALKLNMVWATDPLKKKSKCYKVPQDKSQCDKKKNNVFVWFETDQTCRLPPNTAGECALLGLDREWRDNSCYPTTEKTCLLSPYHIWFDEGCHFIPTNEIDCAKTAFYDWGVLDEGANSSCNYMTSCQGSSKRIWVQHTMVVSGKKGKKRSKASKASKDSNSKVSSKDSNGSNTPVMQRRNNLSKRDPRKGKKESGSSSKSSSYSGSKTSESKSSKSSGSKSSCNSGSKGSKRSKRSKGSKGSKCKKHGRCLVAPEDETRCEAVGHGYFWDNLQSPAACVFKTHCDTNIIERDWIAGACVVSPASVDACNAAENYAWYKASDGTTEKCHYKDRCKLEPSLDWFVKAGQTEYGCHGATECNAKGHWSWNNVLWPELYIASPYFDLAETGFFICQPTTLQICNAQADAEWTWWENRKECRLSPTLIESCIELPNLHWNDIVASYWENHVCMIIQQEPKPPNLDLVKRGRTSLRTTSYPLTTAGITENFNCGVGANNPNSPSCQFLLVR